MDSEQLELMLTNAKHDAVHEFSHKGLRTKAKVTRVYDGDTLHLCTPHMGCLNRFTCRMLGYDSPELIKKQDYSIQARNALVIETTNIKELHPESNIPKTQLDKLLDDNTKIVEAEFHGKDKYGRELVNLYDDSGCINKRMLEKYSFNKPYNGKKKPF